MPNIIVILTLNGPNGQRRSRDFNIFIWQCNEEMTEKNVVQKTTVLNFHMPRENLRQNTI